MRSLRLAFRVMFKSPFVTTIAILSLALGIGANAAIFSMFDQILLAALPAQDADRLMNLTAPGPKPGSQSCNQAGDCEAVFSYPMFRDLEASPGAFSGLAAHRMFGANIAYQGETLNGQAIVVSGSYFPVLGLRPAAGRLFGPADDETIGGHPVAVLSHAFWQGRLGGTPDVVGRPIVVNGVTLTVVGVAPDGFHGTTVGSRPLVYVPLTMRAALSPWFDGFENRRTYWAYVFGRLRPGATLEQASAAMNAVYVPLINDVEAPLQEGMSEQTMARFRARTVLLEEGHRGQSSVHGEARIPLLLLLGTAGIVLLIACANIANLLLARGAGRAMEMAVRLSLGATRRQVLGQLLTESLLLAALGGLASLIVAYWTLRGIAAMMPPFAAETFEFALSMPVVLCAAVLSIGTGILFGMFPALHSTRPDLVTTIRSGAGNLTATRGAARFRTALVTAQIALSMALLAMAGLFLKSLVNISRVDLGFEAADVFTFGVSPTLNGYEPARAQQLFLRIEEELAALPGVTGVTSAIVPLVGGDNWGTGVQVQGFESGPDVDTHSNYNEVGPAYFSTLQVPLLAGREFTEADNEAGTDVAIVNETFAAKFNLGGDVVGKFMSGGGDELNVQIVGLARNAAYSQVKDEVPPQFFTPWRQDENVGSMSFYVRTGLAPEQVMPAVAPLIAQLDPNLPVEDLKTLPTQVRENVFLDRLISTMSAVFAGLATLLAAVGLYGVLAYSVATRTREIGVRMSLGADSRAIRGMVLAQVLRMLLVGGLVGVFAAMALGRAAGSLLFGLDGTDPVVLAAASAVLSAFAMAAGYVPALRASRVEPVRALRYE
ncbi:MAG: ABC transporter permease [Gemmatimonadota bacterium]